MAITFLAILPLPPGVAQEGLDASWVQALHVAVEQRLAFGTDIVFTYGPLGFVHARMYWPGLFVVTCAFWALLGVALLDAWYGLVRGSGSYQLVAAPTLAVAAALA